MIRRAGAVRFDRLAAQGRNQPLLITVETDNGDEVDVYLKPSGRAGVGIEGMANELFAACIAGHLGLPTCEPVIVSISPPWISSIQDPETRGILAASCPLAFASCSAGRGWRSWIDDDHIIGQRRANALAIFAFDAFIENRDRRVSNPNLLVRGDDFRIIDHELCFRIRQCLFPRPEPWRVGYLHDIVTPGASAHVFGHRLRGDRFLDVAALRPAWISLSDAALADYAAAVPDEWAEAVPAIQDALTHLRTVRDRIDDCLAEIERALA